MSWMVDRRCAMAIVVRPAISTCSASRISSSVSVSTLDVASSRISTRGSNASARANDSSCFCPTDSVEPRSATALRVAARQALDERVGVHRLRRAPQPLVVDRGVAEPDVVGDRAGEQVHVLQHEAEQPAQRPRDRSSRMSTPSIVMRPRVHVVEPQQQVDQRRLSRAGGADDADALARPHLEADVPQHVVVGSTPSLSPPLPLPLPRPSRCTQTRRGRTRCARRPAPAGDAAPPATGPSTGSSSSLKIRSDDAIADCRTLNFSDMSLIGRKKRCEYCRNATSAPSVSVLAQHAAAAVPDDQRRRQRADGLDRRIEHRVVEDRLDVRVAVLRDRCRRSAAKFSASRRNSCTVAMPVMFSCRNALMRAIQPRTTRYESRTLRRNHCVMRTISGSTENATSASRQFIHSITP